MADVKHEIPVFGDAVRLAQFIIDFPRRSPGAGEAVDVDNPTPEEIAAANTLVKRAQLRVRSRFELSDGTSRETPTRVYPLRPYVDAEATPDIPPTVTQEKVLVVREVLGAFYELDRSRMEQELVDRIAIEAP